MKPQLLKINERIRIATKIDGTRIPVKDSKFSTLIQPNEEDIKNGIPGDHAKCMYCLACRRMYGSDLVWVTRMFAYVELQKKGKPELHRFVLKDPAKANIKDFDAGEELDPDAVIFAAPTGSLTLDAQAKQYRKRRAAYISGEVTKRAQPSRKSRIKKSISIGLRDPATGKFHFRNTA